MFMRLQKSQIEGIGKMARGAGIPFGRLSSNFSYQRDTKAAVGDTQNDRLRS